MSQEDELEDLVGLPETEPESLAEEAASAAVEEVSDGTEAVLTGQAEPEETFEEAIPAQEEAMDVEARETLRAEPEPAPVQPAATEAPTIAPQKARKEGCLRLVLVGLLSVLGGAMAGRRRTGRGQPWRRLGWHR